MKPQSSHHPHRRLWLSLLAALVLLATGLSSAMWWPGVTRASTPDPVTAAWEKAKAAGSYAFTSNVHQKTLPVASISNVGRTSRSEDLYLEGQSDLRAAKLELTLWSGGGSVLQAESGVALRSEGGKTFARRGAGEWEEVENFTDSMAPQGDFLGYLAAIRNVTNGGAETRNGVSFTRYTFAIDGPAFAAYMHEQLVATMRAKGELPASVQLEAPAYYRDMTGSGELWVGEDGLPLRQILDLNFPEQKEERVQAAITVDFANFGTPQTSLTTYVRTGDLAGAWHALASQLPAPAGLPTGILLTLTLESAAAFVIAYRRARLVQTAIVAAVILSQVAGPLLNTFTNVRFFDAQTAKAAAQEEKQIASAAQSKLQAALLAAPEFDPHQSQLQAANSDQSAVISDAWEANLQSLVSNRPPSRKPPTQAPTPIVTP